MIQFIIGMFVGVVVTFITIAILDVSKKSDLESELWRAKCENNRLKEELRRIKTRCNSIYGMYIPSTKGRMKK